MQIRNPFDDYDWSLRAREGVGPLGSLVVFALIAGMLAAM